MLQAPAAALGPQMKVAIQQGRLWGLFACHPTIRIPMGPKAMVIPAWMVRPLSLPPAFSWSAPPVPTVCRGKEVWGQRTVHTVLGRSHSSSLGTQFCHRLACKASVSTGFRRRWLWRSHGLHRAWKASHHLGTRTGSFASLICTVTVYIICLVFHYLISKKPILLVFCKRKNTAKLNLCCIFSELFYFKVTTEIILAQFLYARQRICSGYFCNFSNIQKDKMRAWRKGRLWASKVVAC